MEDFFDLDKLKAKVFLLKDGDTRNMAMLTDEKLLLVRDGKKVLFQLDKINALSSGTKKLLFPLILGGVIAPFSFLSYFTYIFHPLFHLMFILAGLLLFYIGWTGKAVLIIIQSNGEENFIYLPSISKNLLAFIDYLNGRLRKSKNSDLHNFIFIESLQDNYEWLYRKSPLAEGKFPLLGYTYRQMTGFPVVKPVMVAINPELAGREVRFVFDEVTNEMRPEIDGPVNENSIVRIADLDKL